MTLHQQDGGHRFDGGVSFPMEAPDEPITTPEEAGGWFSYALLWFLAAVTLACFAGVIVAYVNA